MSMKKGTGSLSKALHVQAGPITSWPTNTSVDLMPRKEVWQHRTDAEFKPQIGNSSRLLHSELAIGRTVWQDKKITFQCRFS